jgi:phosphoglycerol transferase MdoB-like AlkP superfamily enzyme
MPPFGEISETVRRTWTTRPALQLATLYVVLLLFFFIAKLTAVSAILDMYTMKSQRSVGMETSGVIWGVVEDVMASTVILCVVLAVDFAVFSLVQCGTSRCTTLRCLRGLGLACRSLLVFGVLVLLLVPFAADMVLLQTRQMRFTLGFVAMYNRDKAEASSVEVDPREVRIVIEMIAGVVVTAVVVTALFVGATDFYSVADAQEENDADRISKLTAKKLDDEQALAVTPSRMEDGYRRLSMSAAVQEPMDEPPSEKQQLIESPSLRARTQRFFIRRRWAVAVLAFVMFVLALLIVLGVSRSVSPVVAAIALNATLNEIFRGVFHTQFLPPVHVTPLAASSIIHAATESYSLYQDDVLYRKTTGFQGPLAFDVEVNQTNLPNVLVLVVESFRYHDSLYLASNTSAGQVLKQHNFTLTPNFDRFAKKGIAFSNMWSSWQTSRSVESILFAQLPLDSITETGTTYGRVKTKLAGMPQLFKQKGYETVFSTGCKLTYDGWNSFFATHGFDSVVGLPQYLRLGETELGITRKDWKAKGLSFNWGVHDDTSFELLGRILQNKTRAQQQRVASGLDKKPFFLNHYTISSHVPFIARPEWYAKNLSSIPDFSPIYEGHPNAAAVKNYVEMRYFQDLTMGKFLDDMEKAGVLNDTIVVITGDHGQSPENGLSVPYINQVSTTHVAGALIARGRLSESAVGTIMDDAVEHYDLLNTLADIVGVPEDGFFQTGVGRSLKRSIEPGTRPVWTNNPMKNLAVVKGHERFEYDAVANRVLLHDAAQDPLGRNDLFDSISRDEQEHWLQLRTTGRDLNAYFKKRWQKKCLTSVKC